jgi:hypothetical protein
MTNFPLFTHRRKQSSSGNVADATLSVGFENNGGSIELNNVIVQNINVNTTLILTGQGGTTTVSSSSVLNSELPVSLRIQESVKEKAVGIRFVVASNQIS